ncbi:MAG: hypothetical protein IKG18_01830 [Atopobiaceae bacterium]|nr:hypothetical protein [Atopobiaceae bacterium]
MERVYWIEHYSELTKMNNEIAEYGGHVTLIASAGATEGQDAVVHAFAVVDYPDGTNLQSK